MSKDGGPAFPAHDYVVGEIQKDGFQKLGESRGMTLRDWFAGMAMAQMLASEIRKDAWAHCEAVAKDAYKMADAMIAERDR